LYHAALRRGAEQWSSPARLRQLRARRLHRLAARAWKVPYYQEAFARAGVQLGDFHDEAVLQQLPFLTKSILQEQFDRAGLASDGGFEVVTSGSTGEPHRVFRTDRDQAQISAVWDRLFVAFGRRRRDRQVNIGSGRPIGKQGPVAMLRHLGVLPPLHQLSSFDPIEKQIGLLQRVQPQMISSYAVALEDLSEAVLEAGVRDIQPRLVYSSAMALSDRCRELCQEAFGVRPLDVYATVEIGPVAWECVQRPGALHLNDDVQIVEVVDADGRPLPDGVLGELVITQLNCFAQPLIRYRIGDLGYRIPGPCSCGRGLALMGPVVGRTKHTIQTADGRVLNSAVVGSCISPFREVRRWQARQVATDAMRVLLVPAAGWTEGSLEQIRLSLQAKLGGCLQVELELVSEIPLAPNGKVQTIVPLDGFAAATAPGSGSDWRSPSEDADFA
jgi:phenylacetate-CoA ligase